MTFHVGEIVDIRSPEGKPTYWDGTQARIIEVQNPAISKIEFLHMGPRVKETGGNYAVGFLSQFYSNWFQRAAPLSPFEESLRSYIRDEFKELGLS